MAWKPAPPSPKESVVASGDEEKKSVSGGGMSATDAKESIKTGGGSLRERMAALQGRGAFGAPSPSPPPVPGPKPIKRAPLVVSPPAEEPDEAAKEPQPDHAHLEDVEVEKEPSQDAETAETKEEVPEEDDEEAKERERRAAIAARMAKLGGARVGMNPPMFAPKPPAKPKPKPAPKADDAEAPEASTSPPQAVKNTPPETSEDVFSQETAKEKKESPAEDAPSIPTPVEVKETGSDTLQDVTGMSVCSIRKKIQLIAF
ncbi:hypothetical protein M422DRAFT_46717 [Sphaerobolus stellatus SS14]|uniref:Unplaced genomic scaffold SPHSTscaffold_36, whole genome shotgun sequence n=1 Tax=Sphaerobolus stellatus (strain SS14) TaxID=990650 RepID=A0A0C9VF96_SPHS4|nr:hypothetical protein M422DRAFT_46717 [Sphaerobolus stellatus SS14]